MCLVLGIDAFLFKVRVAYSPLALLCHWWDFVLVSWALHHWHFTLPAEWPWVSLSFSWQPWTFKRGLSLLMLSLPLRRYPSRRAGPMEPSKRDHVYCASFGHCATLHVPWRGPAKASGVRNNQWCFYHGFTICVLGLPTFCTGRVLRYTFGVADAGIEKVVGVVRSCAAMTSLEEDKGKLQVLGGALERDCLLNGGLHMKTRHPTSLILCCFFGPE